PPMPQPRSATEEMPARRKRWACRAATGRRVACSRPAGVKSIESANSPNFARARDRSRDCVSTAETRSAEWPASRSRSEERRVGKECRARGGGGDHRTRAPRRRGGAGPHTTEASRGPRRGGACARGRRSHRAVTHARGHDPPHGDRDADLLVLFFFKQKTAYEVET